VGSLWCIGLLLCHDKIKIDLHGSWEINKPGLPLASTPHIGHKYLRFLGLFSSVSPVSVSVSMQEASTSVHEILMTANEFLESL